MGYFISIVAQSLRFDGAEFVHRIEMVEFDDLVLVSWTPALDQPSPDDGWLWLAEDTLRIDISEVEPARKRTYHTKPITKQQDGHYLYNWDWRMRTQETIVHLALPPNFIVADTPSNTPSYTYLNRGRICLGWMPSSRAEGRYRLELSDVDTKSFEVEALECVERIEARKSQLPTPERAEHAQEMAKIHRDNIYILERQMAQHGQLNVPLGIINQLEWNTHELEKYERELGWR